MCTVTYIPTQKGFLLTSSRDELKHRPTETPRMYKAGGNCLIYPKDALSGGSWIATDENGKSACLLNGAFTSHEKKTSYSKNRGKVLLEYFNYAGAEEFVQHVDLNGVEPFTLLLLEQGNELLFHEFIWDETKITFRSVNTDEIHIWSSATLYDPDAKRTRKEWFAKWLDRNQDEEDFNILSFHLQKHGNDNTIDILMNRSNGMETVSISQLIVEFNSTQFRYLDLLKKVKTELEFVGKQNSFYA